MSEFGHWEIGAIEELFAGKAAAATGAQPEAALKPYRPGSGTEGMAFDDAWCSRCARDAAWREAMGHFNCGSRNDP